MDSRVFGAPQESLGHNIAHIKGLQRILMFTKHTSQADKSARLRPIRLRSSHDVHLRLLTRARLPPHVEIQPEDRR